MRPFIFLFSILLLASPGGLASQFGSDQSAYKTWNSEQLRKWLDDHHVTSPSSADHSQLVELVKANWNGASGWTYEQYQNAQKSFSNVRDTTFDSWDESRLREFLLEQGIVAPKGPREELVLLAKSRYRAYTDAASSFTSSASRAASTAIYGDEMYQATQSLSSIAAQATKSAQMAMDDTRDYVYSTWDDNQLRTYLEEKGVLKTKAEKRREELLAMMHDTYARIATPVWNAWSDSYMHEWLVSHNIIDGRSTVEKKRDEYLTLMGTYYYGLNDRVWDTWTDSQLRQWLIDHNVVKSDAQVAREKMLKLVDFDLFNKINPASARDYFWDSWTDSQIREWLIEHGYLKSDAQAKRDELVKLINEKYTSASDHTAAYLTWPDARLRAYLREKGFPEHKLPKTRPGLLQEVRIRWVQTQTRAETLFATIRGIVNGGMEAVEEKLSTIWALISGNAGKGWYETRGATEGKYNQAKGKAYKTKEKAKAEL